MSTELATNLDTTEALASRTASALPVQVPVKTQGLLRRMFADPHLLEKEERTGLARDLRECVRAHPEVPELRVLLGMALCVNFEVPDAIEELGEGVRLAPDSFVAHLKMGELWMRLRVCDKAEHHTRKAALLARNALQSELARRQAASIRTLLHNGVKRGYATPWPWIARLWRLRWRRRNASLVAADDVPMAADIS